MATWKKVITEDDSIGIAQGGTGLDSITGGNIIVGNGTSTPSLVHLEDAELLVGAGAGTTAPIAVAITGDVTLGQSGGVVTSTIGTDKVLGSMVNDGTLEWATHQATAAAAANAQKVPIFNSSGVPTLSPAGVTGNYLTIDGNSEIVWGDTLSSASVNIAVSNGAGAKAVALVAGASDASSTSLLQDNTTAFTWNDSNDTLTIGEITLAGDSSSVITADDFTGTSAKSTQVLVTNYGTTNTASAAHGIPHFAGTGNGSQESLISDDVFSYNPGINLLSAPKVTASGSITANIFVSPVATGTSPMTITSTTQVANLHVAKAGIGTKVGVTQTAASNSAHYLTFVSNAGSVTNASLRTDSADLIYIPEDAGSDVGGTLKVPNLIVTGTTTTLNTTNLEVVDHTIKVANSNTTAALAIGAGLIVDINDKAAANLPSILYNGADNSPGGWSISRASSDAGSF